MASCLTVCDPSFSTTVLPPHQIIECSSKTDVKSVSWPPRLPKRVSHVPELANSRSGYLIALSTIVRRDGAQRVVNVRCCWPGCGAEWWVNFENYRAGKTTRCKGCGHRKASADLDRLRKRMSEARARCRNPTTPSYHRYGGRGIEFRFPSVDAAVNWIERNLPNWRSGEVDRANNDGHYEPGNLRVSTRKENVANRANTARVLWMGVLILVSEWRENPYERSHTVMKYVRQGMTGEQIIEQARQAVREKRKNWRAIAARLASTTS